MMSPQRSLWFRVFTCCGSIAAVVLTVACGSLATAQTVRNYNVTPAPAAPVIDGVVSAGEWTGAGAAAGTWGVLRETEADLDTENNRFRMMWDANNLYVLYETDFNVYLDPIDKVGVPNPTISFGQDNLNLYFDPNTDGGPNFVDVPEDTVDGYQFAFNQYHDPDGGSLTSTNANRQGVGFYTEAHAGTPFGNQANWGGVGVNLVEGPAMQNIVVSQRNGTGGGVAEMVFPWANFNADAFVPGTTDASDFNSDGFVNGGDFLIWQRNVGPSTVVDKSTGDADLDSDIDGADLDLWEAAYGTDTRVATGLNRVGGPITGEQWFFNMSRINGDGGAGGNFLPIWNWQPAQSFAFRPHGTLTFLGTPGSPVPEPATVGMIALAAVALGAGRRRRRV